MADAWVPEADGRWARGRQSSDLYPRMSWVAPLIRSLLPAAGIFFCFSLALSAQTAGSDNSWTATSDSQIDNVNPTRTIASHTQSGNRTVDKQSIERRDSAGQFEAYQDIEKETVQVDATTVRTTTRSFGRNADGVKTLVQVTDEERHALPGGDSNVVRTTSNPDADGKLQVVQRQIEETKKIDKDVEETKTTVMLSGVEGGLAPVMKTQERRKHDANDTVESHKTTLLPDGDGKWQVAEIRDTTAKKEGSDRSIEERVLRPDPEGRLGEISRSVSKESGSASAKRNTKETYSVDVPGSAEDGGLRLVERATTAQRTGPTGEQTTEKQVEKPDPGDPDSGPRVMTVTTDAVRPGPSGAQAMTTIQMRDANGNFGVVSVDTTKSDNLHAIQVEIAPSEKPK